MTTRVPNEEENIIACFMQAFEVATDRAAVVYRFADLHPELAPAFADFAEGQSLLKDAAADEEGGAHLLQPGDMLGDFRVKRFLANGGMGEIYEAEQIRLDKRRVALKVIRRGGTLPEMRARFLREQGVLAKLHQANIVPVFAAGEKGEVQYFAMQYIDGATLGNVVTLLRSRSRQPGVTGQTPSLAKLVESAVGPRNDPKAETISAKPQATTKSAESGAAPELTKEYLRSVATSLADVADALNAAHAAGFLHRDIKPSNLMAESSGKCWVIDFGLAGLVGNAPVGQVSNLSASSSDPALTATGSVMGTYAYMAPEQFDGLADPRTDVWALGVTLYELLALDRPFHGPEYREQIRETEPRDVRTASSIVPRDLAAICCKAMRKSPAERYQTASAFAADLRNWLHGKLAGLARDQNIERFGLGHAGRSGRSNP